MVQGEGSRPRLQVLGDVRARGWLPSKGHHESILTGWATRRGTRKEMGEEGEPPGQEGRICMRGVRG